MIVFDDMFEKDFPGRERQQSVAGKQIDLRLAELKLTPDERKTLVAGFGFFDRQQNGFAGAEIQKKGLNTVLFYVHEEEMVVDIYASPYTLKDKVVHIDFIGSNALDSHDWPITDITTRVVRQVEREEAHLTYGDSNKFFERVGTGICSVIAYIKSEIDYRLFEFSSEDKKVGVDLRVDSMEALTALMPEQQRQLQKLIELFGSSIEKLLGDHSLSDAARARAIDRIAASLRDTNPQSEEIK